MKSGIIGCNNPSTTVDDDSVFSTKQTGTETIKEVIIYFRRRSEDISPLNINEVKVERDSKDNRKLGNSH